MKKSIISGLTVLLLISNNLSLESLAEEFTKEISDITNLINKEPNNAEYYIKRADFYSCSNKDLALKDYDKAIQLQPNNPEYYLKRADFYNCQSIQDLAIRDYSKAIEVNNGNIKYYFERGNYYICIGKTDLALDDYNKIIELDPQNSVAYEKKGLIYQDKNDFELALKEFNKSIKLNPKNMNLYFNISYCYKQLNQYNLALKTMNKCIELDNSIDNLISSYIERGRIYYILSDYNLALKDLSYAIYLDPESHENLEAYNLRGLINYLYSYNEIALSDYNKALEINSEYGEALINRALLYKSQNKYELAIKDLESLIFSEDQIERDYIDAYTYKIEIHTRLKEYDLALNDIDELLSYDLDKNDLIKTYLLRATINRETKKYDLALKDVSEILSLAPNDSKLIDTYIEKAQIYIDKEEYDLALKELDYIISEKKDNPDIDIAISTRSIVYAFLGKNDSNENTFIKYKTKKEILDKAKKLIRSGKREEGLKIIESALDNFQIINPFNSKKNYLLFLEAVEYCETDPKKALALLSKVDEEHEVFDELKYLTKSQLFAKQITADKYKECYITILSMESDLNSNKKLKNKDKKKEDLLLDKKYFYSSQIISDFKNHSFKNTLSKIDKLIELDKNDIETIHMKGYALFYLGKRDEGVKLLKKYIVLNPKSAHAYYNLSCFYSILGKKDLSLKNLKISISMNPQFKKSAKKDKDFNNIKNSKEFKSIVL